MPGLLNLNSYHPESYWNEVAKRISGRNDNKLLAGDDEPFYTYKRKKFLKLFNQIPFNNKIVLEIGSGPGGNLNEILKVSPKELHGADVSDEMINLSSRLLKTANIKVDKIDGETLPYLSKYFDISFTSTVLQHNTDEKMLKCIIKEICRVSGSDIYIFERIEKKIKGNKLNLGRPVSYYKEIFEQNSFKLIETEFLYIQISYLICGAIRKVFNSRKRKEGEPISRPAYYLQRIFLPITSILDPIFKEKRDLAMLHFKRI